jgi:small subunit ribosomal protein S15
LSVHKKDKHSKRGLRIIESKIKRLINYYKEKGELDPKFRFNKDQIALYLK